MRGVATLLSIPAGVPSRPFATESTPTIEPDSPAGTTDHNDQTIRARMSDRCDRQLGLLPCPQHVWTLLHSYATTSHNW
jgi:hypothetical protein